MDKRMLAILYMENAIQITESDKNHGTCTECDAYKEGARRKSLPRSRLYTEFFPGGYCDGAFSFIKEYFRVKAETHVPSVRNLEGMHLCKFTYTIMHLYMKERA